jgi:hypothetical protein
MNLCTSPRHRWQGSNVQRLSVHRSPRGSRRPTNGEADTLIIGAETPKEPICKQSIPSIPTAKPPAYPFSSSHVQRAKKTRTKNNPLRSNLERNKLPETPIFLPAVQVAPPPVEG